MRRVILFRHAKSSWADSALEDHARPLNQRGRRAAPLMGAWMAQQGLTPDLAMLSDSARTRETWALAAPSFDRDIPAHEDAALYHASPAAMLRALHAAPSTAATVLLVGHMPGIGALTRKLADGDTPASCARAYRHFPTAAVAVIDFAVETWPEVAYGAGRFHRFACPRELV